MKRKALHRELDKWLLGLSIHLHVELHQLRETVIAQTVALVTENVFNVHGDCKFVALQAGCRWPS